MPRRGINGGPGRTRTFDLPIMRLLVYGRIYEYMKIIGADSIDSVCETIIDITSITPSPITLCIRRELYYSHQLMNCKLDKTNKKPTDVGSCLISAYFAFLRLQYF